MTRVAHSMRARGERGAALVEFTVILPVIVVLLLGMLEFGAAWLADMRVEASARGGARIGSSMSTGRLADYTLLRGVVASLSNVGIDKVSYVVVYNASTSNGAVPAACSGSAPTSVQGVCNVYPRSVLTSLSQSQFSGTTSCDNAALDRSWCPTSRRNILSAGPDYLGVALRVELPGASSLFGTRRTITARAVMRLEPK